jgi:hypothetical protein
MIGTKRSAQRAAHEIADRKGEEGGARTEALRKLSGQFGDLVVDLTARVFSLAFCGNLGPVSAQSQGDLMNVVRSWNETLWKSAIGTGGAEDFWDREIADGLSQ